MPNPYFRFKEFTVYHDRCAMKVGTDGVLLGAWCNTADVANVLDIGTGSGLIAMMIAQRNRQAFIDAIDIDKNAIDQALENFSQSPFTLQIQGYSSSIQSFKNFSSKRYDLVVSNPPFFSQSLKSPDKVRSLARHTESLPIEELIRCASDFLSDKGRISIIYPFEYKDLLIQLATKQNLFITRITNVHPTPQATPKRILIEFCKKETLFIENHLTIEVERHLYSNEFVSLVKDFYLKM